MSKEKEHTRISELGEFGLIDRLTKNIQLKNESTLKGVGDDAAVLNYGDKCVVFSTDLLTEGIHFNLMYVPLKHLGYKSVVVNLSDIFAMNAQPRQITVNIALSNKFSVEAVEELYSGIHLACEKYGIDLVGGDTTSSLTGLTISVSVLGEAAKDDLVYRSGAKEGDILCVSGDLGGAYMGLQLLERENEVFKVNDNMQPQLEGYDYILERQLKPETRPDVIAAFKKIGIKPTSMIDISDGLSSEIMHLCNGSKVGCRLDESKVPMDNQTKKMAEELNINPLVSALNGGEDYELLFTVSPEDYEKLKNDPDFTAIGEMVNESAGAHLIAAGGSEIPLQAQGWNHQK
ncbi:thiamine-phosphate kinase [Tangfeifania diversioriginum]|uniref:Thiamine-monophosphate kinase n=1 Tax=Tangfeifania diversioriginum TaxID=1168035 RepID=A0A1M6AB58_9BACT|nr:thiamine-phosphate kinase [Tangfeifania diversioriginum]SHI33695.1 thiamine-phosphate kinase [Tangfeifania diversioriginum]